MGAATAASIALPWCPEPKRLSGKWYSLVDSLRTSLAKGSQIPEIDLEELNAVMGFSEKDSGSRNCTGTNIWKRSIIIPWIRLENAYYAIIPGYFRHVERKCVILLHIVGTCKKNT